MSFAICSSPGRRREHAMDRASKILNIAIEIGERCELHICSPCVVIGGNSNHCWRWHFQPANVTPSKRLIFIRALIPENNRACIPSKTLVSDSASCWLPDSNQLRQDNPTSGSHFGVLALADWQQCQCS